MGNERKKVPVAIKLLSNQIRQGIYPSKDDLREVFQEVDNIYYRDIAYELLEKLSVAPEATPVVSNEPKQRTSRTANGNGLSRTAPQVAAPTKKLSGILGKG